MARRLVTAVARLLGNAIASTRTVLADRVRVTEPAPCALWIVQRLLALLFGLAYFLRRMASARHRLVLWLPIRRSHRKCDAIPARNDRCSAYGLPKSRHVVSTKLEIAG